MKVCIKTWDEMLGDGGTLEGLDNIRLPSGCTFVKSMERDMPKARIITITLDTSSVNASGLRHAWVEEGWSISEDMIKYKIPQVLFETDTKDVP